jgi:hypothetical protein
MAVEELCNFACKVVEESVLDDGSGEVRHTLVIEGSLADGTPLPHCQVSAADFAGMSWPIREWGTRAIVNAGQGAKDHLRVAIQHASKDAVRRVVYLHTGWRRFGEDWYYLHAEGAIGAAGSAPNVTMGLEGTLAQYRLPDPPSGEALIRAVKASIRLLAAGPAPVRLTAPLLAAVYRAPLGSVDCSVNLVGPSGAGKSELSALAQQHYGAGMDRLHLPGNWLSTGNSLEAMAFQCKDALLTIDDLKPVGSKSDMDRLHALADRVLRGQGNLAGRARCRADGSLRPARPPRGLICSSGETDLRGESLQARCLPLPVAKGDVNIASLTPFQEDAAAGLYAQSMSGYLRWLAPQYEAVRGRLRSEHAPLRALAAQGRQHARVPALVAELFLGLRYFLNFAQAVGAIDADERAELDDLGWQALLSAGKEQSRQIGELDPVRRFLQLLASALAAGRAHLAAKNGGEPDNSEAYGWREEIVGTGQYATPRSRPQGDCVGWIDGTDLFLDPDSSYATVQTFASDQGEVLPISQGLLKRRLKEVGLLLSCEPEKTTTRRTLQGQERAVIHLSPAALRLRKPGEPGEQGETPKNPERNGVFSSPGSESQPGEPGDKTGGNGVLHDADAAAWQAATEQTADAQRF